MDELQVRRTVDDIARAVRADGGDNAVVHVGYRLDGSCDQCVLTPNQLRDLVRSAVEHHVPDVALRMQPLP